jgi:hypothetical protein
MHIRKYYELAQRIQLQGGPDNAQDLYVQAIHMEERVLAQYGLPPTRRFVRILQSLHEYEPLGEEALGKIMKLLELEASEYLLTSPLPDEELLTQAKAQHLNAMDILPEMGVPTQEYMVFVYNQYCRDPTIEAHQVIKEFRIADQQDTLQEILEIREENFPQRDPRYRLLKSRGLQFLDAFLREQEDEEGEQLTVGEMKEQLKQLMDMAAASYMEYLKLRSHGMEDTQARQHAGLGDDLFYRIALYTFMIQND